jgi:hypothetical protein
VILAWVISLLLLCSSLVMSLEKLTALRIISLKTMESSKLDFMNSEKAILECEQHLSNLSLLQENNCFIQPLAKNIWSISSKSKPVIQVHVFLDEKTGLVTRLNWRQAFE